MEYSYGPNDSVSRYLYMTWDSLRVDWDTTSYVDYTWSADSRESIQVSQRPDTSGILQPISRQDRKLDALGRLTEYTYYDYRNATWVPRQRRSLVYDASGKPSTSTFLGWNSATGTYLATSRDTLTYDSQGREIESLNQVFSDTELRWTDQGKELSTYDALGRKVLLHRFKWVPDSLVWSLEVKDTLWYDSADRWVGSRTYRWPKGPNRRDTRDSLAYDAHGNMIFSQTWYLDPATSQWHVAGGTQYREIIYSSWGEMIAYERWIHQSGWNPQAKEVLQFEGSVATGPPAVKPRTRGRAKTPAYRYDLRGRRQALEGRM